MSKRWASTSSMVASDQPAELAGMRRDDRGPAGEQCRQVVQPARKSVESVGIDDRRDPAVAQHALGDRTRTSALAAEPGAKQHRVGPSVDIALDRVVIRWPRLRERLVAGRLRDRHIPGRDEQPHEPDPAGERRARRKQCRASHTIAAGNDRDAGAGRPCWRRREYGGTCWRTNRRIDEHGRRPAAAGMRAESDVEHRDAPAQSRAMVRPRLSVPNVSVRSARTAPSAAPVVASTPLGTSRDTTIAPRARALPRCVRSRQRSAHAARRTNRCRAGHRSTSASLGDAAAAATR